MQHYTVYEYFTWKLLYMFPNKINCVTLHLVGYILEYSYDARTHEHSKLLVSRLTIHQEPRKN
jgi:hypothetical protein